MSQTEDRQILGEINNYIERMITNQYNDFSCMLEFRERIILTCFRILNGMLEKHGVRPPKSIELLYKAYDQESSSRTERLLYCYFYIAYCHWVVEYGNVPGTPAPTPSVGPSIFVLRPEKPSQEKPEKTPSLKPQESPVKGAHYDPKVLEDFDYNIKELNKAIDALHERIHDIEERSKGFDEQKKDVDILKTFRENLKKSIHY
jgi:hypothetical protein